MEILAVPIPHELQWLDLAVSFGGTGLTIWAALSARSARQQAELAKEAVRRVAQTVQVADLVEGMHELQLFIARGDFQLVAAKASQLHSRVVRFWPRDTINSTILKPKHWPQRVTRC